MKEDTVCRRWIRKGRLFAAWMFGSALLTAGAAPAEPLQVFAAASLTEAFQKIGEVFRRKDGGREVMFNFAGSQQLAAQIELGAAADVFASADQQWMVHVAEKNGIAGEATIFVRNRLVVVTPRGGKVTKLADLAAAGTKVVLAAGSVPVGRYSRQVLDKLAQDEAFGTGFNQEVLANVVSEEENVKSVLAKVQLGEADAGIVYGSDVTSAAAKAVAPIEIAEKLNIVASYPIAVLEGSRDATAAQAFVDLVLSAEGQRILAEHGFMIKAP